MAGETNMQVPKALQSLKRFRPRPALEILSAATAEKALVLKIWSLARLLAWMMLDQAPGKRPAKSENSSGKNRPRIRTKYARQAGQWTLVYLLDREIRQPDDQRHADVLKAILALLSLGGGFSALAKGRSVRGLLSLARSKQVDLDYIYRITEFLCRYDSRGGEPATIEVAEYFAMRKKWKGKKHYGLQKISQIWERHKHAAPYIYAFYGMGGPHLKKTASTPDNVMAFIETFVSNQRRLNGVIGRAAYSAQVMSRTRARNVRTKDFRDVPDARQSLKPFSQEELSIIKSYDPSSPFYNRLRGARCSDGAGCSDVESPKLRFFSCFSWD
jgi:hypothetical protein